MPIARIIRQKSLTATLKNFRVGEDYVIPSTEFDADNIRKTASSLRSQGYKYTVAHKGITDTIVRRLK
jgi:hypothetical protein